MAGTSANTDFPWLDLLTAVFTGAAAVGAIWALVIALRALAVARESVAYDQLFVACADVIRSLQEIERRGSKLGSEDDGSARSRQEIGDPFQDFLAARARVDLATGALGLRGERVDSTLDLAHNLAGDVLQADEFDGLHVEFMQEKLGDQTWMQELSWFPSPEELQLLSHSHNFVALRFATMSLPPASPALRGLDRWMGERILQAQAERSVYSVKASYLTQVSRLLDDFTNEYVQPLFEEALKVVAKSTKRLTRPLE